MKQISVLILLLLTLSCNFEKKRSPILDNFKIAEKEFNHYNTYRAIQYYKLCINPVKSEKDSIAFKAYCRLINCYYRLDAPNELCLTFRIVDSFYKNNSFAKRFSYYYILSCALYYHTLKNYSNAAIYFQKAIGLLHTYDTLACFLNYKLGVCYEKQNNITKAESYYRKALSIAKGKKEHFSNELADCYNVIALIYLSKYSDFYTAKLYYDSVLYTSARCQHLDSATYAWNLFNIGNFYHIKELYLKADQYYFESYNIYSKLRNHYDELMKVLSYQVNILSYLGKFDIAHNKIDITISYYLKKLNPEGLQDSYSIKAYLFFCEKDYKKAILYYLKAAVINEKFLLPGNEKLFNNIAWCYLNINILDSANIYFKKSIELLNNKEFKNINTLVTLYGEYSRMLIEKGQYNEALQTIESKLPYVAKTLGKKNSQYGYFIYWKALSLENLNRVPASLDFYQKVIQASVDPNLKSNVYDIPSFKVTDIISHENLIDGLTGKADVLVKMAMMPENKKQKIFLLQKSLGHYAKAREVVESYNKQIGSESNRLQFTGSKESVYEKELASAIRLYRVTGKKEYLEKAFISADRNKAVQLTFGMKDEQYKRIGGVPDSLVRKDKNLKEETELLQSSIREESLRDHPDSVRINYWRNKLLAAMNELEKLSRQIDEKYPRYFQLKYTGNDLDIDMLKRLVGPRKTLIEYAFTSDSLYTFVLSCNKLQLLSQPSHGIEDSIGSFRNHTPELNESVFTWEGIKSYISNTWWLYCKLITPFESFLVSKEIIIIPDGMINLLPFEALVTSDSVPRHIDYGLLSYIVYKYSISYTYSARLFEMQQKLQTLQTDKVLAYAPVYNIPFNQLKTIFKTSDTILSPLLNSKVEVKSITRVFGGRAFIGKRATKANFKKHASDGKILHLAMHTMVDNEYSMNLKLVFSKTGYTTNNYFLTADEIYNMKLRSPLVVLSACNSGYGKLIKGEGVISLARGFVYAGCPSMVISLWSVGDLSSSEIMFQFYKNLKNNLTIDKALQQAKIKYIINSNHMYSHPYYWAGFIQTGKTDSFIITSKNHHFVLIILLGLCLTFGVFIYWFVKEKNKPV